MLPLGAKRRAKRQRDCDALADELCHAAGACRSLGDAGREALRSALHAGLAAAAAADGAADAAADGDAQPDAGGGDGALTRVSLCVVLQPLQLPRGGDAEWAALRRAARAVAWPQRSLAWAPGAGAVLPAPPRLALCCSLLAGCGGDDAAAEAELLRRLRAATGARACASVALAAAAPIPLLPRAPAALSCALGDAAAAAATLRRAGVALLPGAAAADDVVALAALAAARVQALEAALSARQVRPFRDDFACADAASRGAGRVELRLPVQGAVAALAQRGACAAVARAALGVPAPAVTASVVVSRPGAPEQSWHADGPHLQPPRRDPWAAAAGRCAHDDEDEEDEGAFAPDAPPYALCVFVALCHVTPALGPPQFWLGSHGGAGLVELAAAALGADGARLAEGPAVLRPPLRAGDAVAYDYRTLHRGGGNAGGTDRPLLQLVYRRGDAAGWDEGQNFGSDALLHEAPPGGWAVRLPAGPEEEAQAAAGAAAWAAAAAARSEAVAVAPPPAPKQPPPAAPPVPSASGWAVFD